MNMRKQAVNYTGGFSLLELIVVIVIVSILFALALDHLFKWRVTAEQTSIKKLTSEMRGALKLEVASYYAKGRMQDIITLVASNPLKYTVGKPGSYIGEYKAPNLGQLEPGSWVYDTAKKLLIYRVRHPEHFITKLPGIKRIELKISLIYADIDKNSRFNRDVDTIEGLSLKSTAKYTWKLDEK